MPDKKVYEESKEQERVRKLNEEISKLKLSIQKTSNEHIKQFDLAEKFENKYCDAEAEITDLKSEIDDLKNSLEREKRITNSMMTCVDMLGKKV